LLIFYIFDKKKHLKTRKASKDPSMKSRMLNISLPIALSSYLRSGLVTVQHILIPSGLRKHGSDYASALASYGTIHGMVFPLILFPSAVCTTFSGLIVPELSELAASYGKIHQNRHICYIVRRALSLALIFGIGTAGILLCFSDPLGILVYKSAEAAKYIRVFAPLVPIMYLDTTVDGMLKGLGQQLHSMFYNIIDASMSVFLVWSLMPKVGILGYVICVFVTEIINLSFSLTRLLTVTGAKLPILKSVICPILCIAGSAALSVIALRMLSFPFGNAGFSILGISLAIVFYIILLRALGGLSSEDSQWFQSILKK
jgi:stage V sporulation protein B